MQGEKRGLFCFQTVTQAPHGGSCLDETERNRAGSCLDETERNRAGSCLDETERNRAGSRPDETERNHREVDDVRSCKHIGVEQLEYFTHI